MTSIATDGVPAAWRWERSRTLAWLAGFTVLLYVATSTVYLVGSLQVGDVWLAVMVLIALGHRSTMLRILRVLQGAYGALALALTSVMLLGSLHAHDFLRSLDSIAQLLFVIWVLVPLIAAGVAAMDDPAAFLRSAGILYLLTYTVGLVLLFGAGSDLILFQSGIGRVFQRLSTHALHFGLMSVAMAGVVAGGAGRGRDVGLILLALMPVLFNASRTGLVGFGVLGAFGVLGSVGRLRRAPVVVAGLVLVAVAGTLLVTSDWFQNLWQVRVLSAASFLEDDIRMASFIASWDAIRFNALTLLFGDGWASSGGGIVVHNVVLQVWHEGGIFVLVALIALLLLPAIRALAHPRGDAVIRQAAIMLTSLNLVYWMLNALSVERVYWLPYAIALGLAEWLRAGARGSA